MRTRYVSILLISFAFSCATTPTKTTKNLTQEDIFPIIIKLLIAQATPIESIDFAEKIIETGDISPSVSGYQYLSLLGHAYRLTYGITALTRYTIRIEDKEIKVQGWVKTNSPQGSRIIPIPPQANEYVVRWIKKEVGYARKSGMVIGTRDLVALEKIPIPTQKELSAKKQEQLEMNLERPKKGWKRIKIFTGNSSKQTEEFYIPTEKWRIWWKTKGDCALSVSAKEVKDKYTNISAISATDAGEDISYIYEGRKTYYLDVIFANASNGSWEAAIEIPEQHPEATP